MSLDKFFNPQSVAVVGASENPGKLGYGVLNNVINEGLFSGKIFPINPKSKMILGLKTYPSLKSLPQKVDLVIVVIPAKAALPVIEEGAQKGIKNFVVISAGFKEADEDGQEMEKELIKIIEKYHLNLLGPNCLGFLQPYSCLNASFAVDFPIKGKIAFASQSGALCTGILDRAVREKLGFSYFVSIGNKAGITEIDLLEYWENDPNVKIIAFYLEGIEDGKKFLEVTRRVSLKKPIIIVYPGESDETQAAISSHTGSLAAGAKAALTAFSQGGLIYTQSIEDLFDLMMIFSYTKNLDGNNLAVVTNAGGPGVLTTDLIMKQGLGMATLSAKNLARVKDKFPPMAAVRNPFDVLGDAPASRYKIALDTVLRDKNTDAVLVILTPQLKTEIKETAEVMLKMRKKYKKIILAAFIGGWKVNEGIEIFRQRHFPAFYFPERAILAFKRMMDYKAWRTFERSKTKTDIKQSVNLTEYDRRKIKGFLKKAEQRKERFLSDEECFEIGNIFGFPSPKQTFAEGIKEIEQKINEVKTPIVLKISHPEHPHKSDIGGVKVKLSNLEEVTEAAQKMAEKMKAQGIRGYRFMLQEMVLGDYEIIMGVKKDQLFGHLIMFGAGGIYTEVYEDVSFRLAPFTRKDTEKMIKETKMYEILKGMRGQEGANLDLLADILEKISVLVIAFPEIEELDFNPVIAKGDNVWVADIKIRV